MSAPRDGFRCHLCGGVSARVVVQGDTKGEVDRRGGPSDLYTCTNRGHGKFVRVVECASCHLRALHPSPPAAEVERSYVEVEDPEYLVIEPQRRIAFQRLVGRVGAWCAPPGRLLDVGCYTGLFPLVAQERGWDVFGIEPSRWAARIAAQRLGSRVTAGFLRDVTFAPASFDIVTSWDVIEHVTDPMGDLARMARLLRPGGWLFLSTMASDAPIVRVLGRRWPWYMEMHRFYFTPATLGTLLQRCGFRVRAIERYPHYTNVEYLCWKFESYARPVARAAGRAARALNLADRTVKIDFGDFFLAVVERR